MQYDKDNKGGLSLGEMVEMGRSGRKIMDPCAPLPACAAELLARAGPAG